MKKKTTQSKNKITSRYEAVINGASLPVASREEAETRVRAASKSELWMCYVVRRDFNSRGELIEEYFVG